MINSEDPTVAPDADRAVACLPTASLPTVSFRAASLPATPLPIAALPAVTPDHPAPLRAPRPAPRHRSRAAARLRSGADAGMSTAEYAVGTVAACGFAALLWTILHSTVVEHALSGLITRALGMV